MTVTYRQALVAVVVVSLVLAGCTAAGPTANAEETPPASASASVAPSATPRATGDGPPACVDAKLVYADSLEQLVLANCFDQFDLDSVERLWTWDGEAWELVEDEGPPAHVVTGIGWDGERDVLVRYGGIPLASQECSAETWEWDTNEWLLVETDPPEPCDHIELAPDASAARLVLIGGGSGQELMSGTWAWDGAAWSLETDAGPAPRAHHGLVHDGAHAQTFLYGGYDGDAVFADFWSWDGAAWEELAIPGAGPGRRSHHGLAGSVDGLLLFGGASGASTFRTLGDETWFLTNGRWSEHSGPGPSARGLPALGYDVERDVFVLYGGFESDGSSLADTWEWDGAWRCVAGC